MIATMSGLLAVVLAVYFFECRKEKEGHRLSFALLFLVIVLMAGGNSFNADSRIYMRRYGEAAAGWSFQDSQWAMSLFSFLCSRAGLSYMAYRTVFFAVGIGLIAWAGYRVLGRSMGLLALYMLFPMMIDATQMKNFMAMAIVTNAILLLARRDWKGNLGFILLILLAAGFQITAYAYLPLIIFCSLSYKRSVRFAACLPIFLFVVIFSRGSTGEYIYEFVLTAMDSSLISRVDKFFHREMNLGYLVYIFATAASFLLVRYGRRIFLRSHEGTEKQRRVAEIIYLCSIYSFVFIPFYFFAQDFSRLLRNFSIINHIMFLLALKQKKADLFSSARSRRILLYVPKGNRRILLLGYLGYLIYMFYWDIGIYWESVVLAFLNHNFYLEQLPF